MQLGEYWEKEQTWGTAQGAHSTERLGNKMALKSQNRVNIT